MNHFCTAPLDLLTRLQTQKIYSKMAQEDRLPALNALRAFEAAARHLSFTRAAEELNVTPGAISQQIRPAGRVRRRPCSGAPDGRFC